MDILNTISPGWQFAIFSTLIIVITVVALCLIKKRDDQKAEKARKERESKWLEIIFLTVNKNNATLSEIKDDAIPGLESILRETATCLTEEINGLSDQIIEMLATINTALSRLDGFNLLEDEPETPPAPAATVEAEAKPKTEVPDIQLENTADDTGTKEPEPEIPATTESAKPEDATTANTEIKDPKTVAKATEGAAETTVEEPEVGAEGDIDELDKLQDVIGDKLETPAVVKESDAPEEPGNTVASFLANHGAEDSGKDGGDAPLEEKEAEKQPETSISK